MSSLTFRRHIRYVMIDSIRYRYADLAIRGKWDVAQLVTWGCTRLNYYSSDILLEEQPTTLNDTEDKIVGLCSYDEG